MAEYRGDRIKALREQNNMSQEELAKAIGVTRLSISNYERGTRTPDVIILNKLADTLSVTSDYLLGRSDAKKAENEDIAKRLGLSEKAIDILQGKFKIDERNSFTLTVNTLIEDQYLLQLISSYLYWEVDQGAGSPIPAFATKCKYKKSGMHYVDSDNDLDYMEPFAVLDAFDNEKYKKVTLLEIQEQLIKLLEKEDHTIHF